MTRSFFAMLFAFVLVSGLARAQTEDPQRVEARERFDRGLRLFNAGDNSGALAEFQRVYEITQHPLVLFNIGLVYAAMREPVQAEEALAKLLANPGQLDAERLARARALQAEQQALIGYVEVVTPHANGAVEVDNVQVATTPLDKPIPVASGNRVVALIVPGYHPLRKQLMVAGRSTVKLEGELRPLEGRLAQLEIRANVQGANVLVGSEVVGQTPLPASLALAPGSHDIELRREGYRTERKQVQLGDGASGRLDFRLEVDSSALFASSGHLALDISESDAVVFVNGEPHGSYSSPLQLPHGPHRLRVERKGFFPYERDVVIPKGSSANLRIELQPTPEYRADYVSRTRSQRSWGWLTTSAGLLATGGSIGFLVWNASEESTAKRRFDEEAAKGQCTNRMDVSAAECEAILRVRLQKLQDVRGQTKFGYIGLGVGVASAALGTYLLVSNDDPARYEPKAESDVFGRLDALPSAWITADSIGLALAGRF